MTSVCATPRARHRRGDRADAERIENAYAATAPPGALLHLAFASAESRAKRHLEPTFSSHSHVLATAAPPNTHQTTSELATASHDRGAVHPRRTTISPCLAATRDGAEHVVDTADEQLPHARGSVCRHRRVGGAHHRCRSFGSGRALDRERRRRVVHGGSRDVLGVRVSLADRALSRNSAAGATHAARVVGLGADVAHVRAAARDEEFGRE